MNSILRNTVLTFLIASFFVITAFTSIHNGEPTKATNWKIDAAHSSVSFEITHFFTPISGKFHEYSSEIYFDPDNLTESSISVDIQVNSVDTDKKKRDGHLQSPDFFNAEKYPTMTFKSNKITSKGDNTFIAHGKLTIKDTTTDFKLPFTLLGIRDNPMRENTRVAGIKSDFTLNRTDYGVGVGDWAATAVVGDEVDVSLALELNSSKK
ncbi:YceI family protein [Fodinibius halophilus]|uniref:YceI family protein n=1 Tax=Fodinibius halophilus TaxID=1736908 RepID=A0A6M1T248_9BACT|nr:YceI family protein [Fodinibius halophilus]NGP89546.1 YceI family protein [Fodinibius halophilus]